MSSFSPLLLPLLRHRCFSCHLCVQMLTQKSKLPNGQSEQDLVWAEHQAKMSAAAISQQQQRQQRGAGGGLAFLDPQPGDESFAVDQQKNEVSPLLIKGEQSAAIGCHGHQAMQENAFRDEEEEEEAGSQGQLDQTEIYRELILRHLIADISSTCTKLGLPTELALWTMDDCRRWVAEMCVQFQLNIPPDNAFAGLDGRTMLALGVEEFQLRVPNGGDTLHAQLQLWKTAFESCGHPQYQQQQQHFVQQQPPSLSSSQSCHPQQNCYGSNGASPPNNNSGGGWLTPSPNEFGSASSCSSASHFSNNSCSQPPFPGHHPQQHQQQQHFYSPNGLFHNSTSSYASPKFTQNGQTRARLLGPSSDCSTVESVSSGSSEDSSSVTEEDFLASNDVLSSSSASQPHFFLPAHPQQHQQQQELGQPQQMSAANFCQFPAPLEFPQMVEFGQTPSQQAAFKPQQRLPSHGTGGTIHLWHFIRELLDQPKEYGGCVRWVDRNEGTFKIESSHHLARYWGIRKNRSAMNYDKLSRSLRQYYKKGIIQKPEKKQRLVYKFLPPYNH